MKPTREELAIAGVCICHTTSGFHVQKYVTPKFQFAIDGIHVSTFDEADNAAEEMWEQINNHKEQWNAIMRYNRGLGVEMKELGVFDATTEEEANQKAEAFAEKLIATDKRFHLTKIIHIKVRPIMAG